MKVKSRSRTKIRIERDPALRGKVKGKIAPILIFFIFLISGCQQNKAVTTQGPQVIPVRIEKVTLRDLTNILEYVGSIKAKDEVLVYPKVSGKIIEKVKEEGLPVTKGDALVYIDRDEVGLKFEKAPVESPVTGVVGRIYVDIGSSVLTQTPIALIVSMDTVKIHLDIPEIYLPKISLGQEATVVVDAYPGEVFLGKVTMISPMVNLENRAAPVEISIGNPGHLLKSGMFVKVSLVIQKHPLVPVILKEAIIGKDPDTYVYVIENDKASKRKISLGLHEGSLYEVTQGLREGEMVVIVGQQRLYEGASVNVEMGNGNGQGDAQ